LPLIITLPFRFHYAFDILLIITLLLFHNTPLPHAIALPFRHYLFHYMPLIIDYAIFFAMPLPRQPPLLLLSLR
jgi:hypothetical protein